MDKYHKVVGRFDSLSERTVELQKKIQDNNTQIAQIEAALGSLFDFNQWLNVMVKHRLETITNAALQNIFPDKDMAFRVQANRTKRGVFYDLYIETNQTITGLMDTKGGGVLDVIQMCLRITYLSKFKGRTRQLMVLDEPFKNLDIERVNLAGEWLNQVTQQLGIQFVVITHIPSLILSIQGNGNIEIRYADQKSLVVQNDK